MKQYIKPEIEIELIETENQLLDSSQDINTGGDGDSFGKHGYGAFDLEDDIADEEDY